MRSRLLQSLRRFDAGMKQFDHTYMVVLAVVIGLGGGLFAVAFRKFIHFAQVAFWQRPDFTLATIRTHPWWWIVLAPAAGGLIVGLIVYFFAREAKGHGVPEVIEAVMLRGGRIRPRVVVAKMIASGICIGSGGSVGREGPIVQIGSSLGSSLGQWLRLGERRMRTLVGCGAAAGIAGTFNAPIAGALFAVEIILGDFALYQLSPIVVSSVSATVVCHHFLGNSPAFVVPAYALANPLELLVYAFLGLVAGLVALAFIRALYGMEDLFDGLPCHAILKPILGGALIGVMALWRPEIFGVGYETIGEALQGQWVWHTLVILAVFKILAVSLTLGSGGSGGIFAPSLFIGAMLGGAVGHTVHFLWPTATATPGAYALVGMGALVAATTHAPITAIMIIFELTNDYKIILPLMICSVIATLLATRLMDASIYTLKLIRRGIDVHKGQSLNVLRHLKITEVMREPTMMVGPGEPLTRLLSAFMDDPGSSIFVVNSDRHLLGIITMNDLRPLMTESSALESLVIAHDIMRTRGFPVLDLDHSLDDVMRRMSHYRFEVPVLQDGRLVGVVWPEDVIHRYNAEIFKRDMASSMAVSVGSGPVLASVPGAQGVNMAEIPVPGSFVGKSCAELDIRKRFGATVLLIRRREGADQSLVNQVPDADYVFLPGDLLLVLGPKRTLERLEQMG